MLTSVIQAAGTDRPSFVSHHLEEMTRSGTDTAENLDALSTGSRHLWLGKVQTNFKGCNTVTDMTWIDSRDGHGSVPAIHLLVIVANAIFILDMVCAFYLHTRHAGLPRSATQGPERNR